MDGLPVDRARSSALKELAAIENDDSIAHQECFSLIVCDMHQGRAESALNADHFLAESRAQREVEAGERFVKQKHARLPSERATDRDALALAAGKGVGTPCQHMVKPENPGDGVDLGSRLGALETSCAKTKSQVIGDRQMRIKRRVLKTMATSRR